MKKYTLLPLLGLISCASGVDEHPNVIVILADDLGCGDLSALGSTVLETPNIDRLCNEGLNLTDAHSAAPTSTPSRYSMMTGLYPWRNAQAEILKGDANLLISTEQLTLPKVMKQAGYVTGAIGKWHLGLGDGKIDWNKEIRPCPNDIGFDYSYIIAATVDRVPTVYVENGYVDGLDPADPLYVDYEKNFEGEPTLIDNPELVRVQSSQGHSCSILNGIGRIGYQTGGKSAYWDDEAMAEVFLEKVKGFIDEHGKEPFFLYYGLHQPHVPRTPNPRFAGTSGMGPRGDVVLEADWCVGELLDYLDDKGLSKNTIIIFSSDNGPVLDDGYVDMAREKWGDRHPAQPYRGGKYSLYDGGTHMPFFVRWPARIAPGTESDALISQMDLLPSFASILGQEIPDNIDGEDLSDVLFGKGGKGRKELVLGSDRRLSFRVGKWHIIPPYCGEKIDMTGTETGNSDKWVLYDTANDIAEQNDLSGDYPDKLVEMQKLFKAAILPDAAPVKWQY